MKKISFLIPCHNESETLIKLHSELVKFVETEFCIPVEIEEKRQEVIINMKEYLFEFLLINDGSRDNTLEIMNRLRAEDDRVSVLNLSRNFGKENAMLAGMDYVSGDATVIMDADLQDPIEVVPEMIYWWEQGYIDIYGKRLDRGKESRLRRFLSLRFYNLLGKMSNIDILENVGDFRLLDRKAIDVLSGLRETQRYTKGLFCWIGFDKKEVVFNRNDRDAGKSNFNFLKLINLAIEGITSYTTAPLRISTIVGFIISFFAFIYLIYMFVKTLIWGDPVTGFPTLICVILFLGGIQLLGLGIIGEYIGRIFNETKRREPYIVESFKSSQNNID